MRPFRSDRKPAITLASLFDRRQQDYKSLELAIEAGDLARAQRALARCREDNREIAVAAGISNSSAVGLIGAILLKTDLTVLKSAFQTGQLPPELARHTAQQPRHQTLMNNDADEESGEEAIFLRDLCTALQAEPPKPRTNDHGDSLRADANARADDANGGSYHFCIKQL